MNKRAINREKLSAVCKACLWGFCILLFPVLSGVLSAVFSLKPAETLFLQGGFMLLSLTVPLGFARAKRWSRDEIGLSRLDFPRCKKAAYFLPLLAVLIPPAVKGFCIPSAAYGWGNLFLYLNVGIAEEVYFRGVIPKYLGRSFSLKGVVILSAMIFGIGHITSAFVAESGTEVVLSVVNALIFGLLAIEMAVISKNILPCVLFHFLFDFETKIVVLSGKELWTAECVRGVILLAAAIWLGGVLARLEKVKSP